MLEVTIEYYMEYKKQALARLWTHISGGRRSSYPASDLAQRLASYLQHHASPAITIHMIIRTKLDLRLTTHPPLAFRSVRLKQKPDRLKLGAEVGRTLSGWGDTTRSCEYFKPVASDPLRPPFQAEFSGKVV